MQTISLWKRLITSAAGLIVSLRLFLQCKHHIHTVLPTVSDNKHLPLIWLRLWLNFEEKYDFVSSWHESIHYLSVVRTLVFRWDTMEHGAWRMPCAMHWQIVTKCNHLWQRVLCLQCFIQDTKRLVPHPHPLATILLGNFWDCVGERAHFRSEALHHHDEIVGCSSAC